VFRSLWTTGALDRFGLFTTFIPDLLVVSKVLVAALTPDPRENVSRADCRHRVPVPALDTSEAIVSVY
jgi:hypothetical protein